MILNLLGWLAVTLVALGLVSLILALGATRYEEDSYVFFGIGLIGVGALIVLLLYAWRNLPWF